jgi:hypothetical protein
MTQPTQTTDGTQYGETREVWYTDFKSRPVKVVIRWSLSFVAKRPVWWIEVPQSDPISVEYGVNVFATEREALEAQVEASTESMASSAFRLDEHLTELEKDENNE